MRVPSSTHRSPGDAAPHAVTVRAPDRPYWADRVADLGIGTAHGSRAPTAGALSAAPGTAPRARARVRTVAAAIHAEGATAAVRPLLGATVQERPALSA